MGKSSNLIVKKISKSIQFWKRSMTLVCKTVQRLSCTLLSYLEITQKINSAYLFTFFLWGPWILIETRPSRQMMRLWAYQENSAMSKFREETVYFRHKNRLRSIRWTDTFIWEESSKNLKNQINIKREGNEPVSRIKTRQKKSISTQQERF